MGRLLSALVFAALALPASLSLPGRAVVVAGDSCAISCGHAAGEPCCCRTEGAGAASLRRCASERDGYTPVAFCRVVLSGSAQALTPPARSELLDPSDSSLPARVPRGLPEPVPRLLS